MHPFGSYCIGSLGGGGGFRGGGGDVVCKRLALASAGVVSLGVASTVVEPIGGAVDDEGGGAGSRGDVATDNPHNSANAAANTTKVPRRNRADVIRNLPHSLQGAAGEGRVASQVLTPKSCPSKKQQCQKICAFTLRRLCGRSCEHVFEGWVSTSYLDRPAEAGCRGEPAVKRWRASWSSWWQHHARQGDQLLAPSRLPIQKGKTAAAM